MMPYTTDEKLEFLDSLKTFNSKEYDSRVLVDYCLISSNLAMLETIIDFGSEEIFEKVETLYELIWQASESNSLKVANWHRFLRVVLLFQAIEFVQFIFSFFTL